MKWYYRLAEWFFRDRVFAGVNFVIALGMIATGISSWPHASAAFDFALSGWMFAYAFFFGTRLRTCLTKADEALIEREIEAIFDGVAKRHGYERGEQRGEYVQRDVPPSLRN